jgi:hypothetical protein
MNYEISEEVKQNLLAFLNRVSIQGLQEISAINKILTVLNSPINNSNININNKEEK